MDDLLMGQVHLVGKVHPEEPQSYGCRDGNSELGILQFPGTRPNLHNPSSGAWPLVIEGCDWAVTEL